MGNSNDKKSATLGMPHGTAANRLRKILLFDVLRRHDENFCVRCSGIIKTVDDLSIEHKKPWEGISADLFWDLDNIAFSHIACNRPHVHRGGEGKRKIGAPGTEWCTFHEKFEPVENFWTHNTRWNGFRPSCKTGRYGRNEIKNS